MPSAYRKETSRSRAGRGGWVSRSASNTDVATTTAGNHTRAGSFTIIRSAPTNGVRSPLADLWASVDAVLAVGEDGTLSAVIPSARTVK